jgi:RNA-directed DNA polymerase
MLDDLDKELSRRGLRFCRYADDCNIYVRSRRAGERVRASVSRFLTNKLRLKVNKAKSSVARPEERKFLGFSIANDGSERRIAPKALAKFKVQIRDMTRRTRAISLPQMVKDLAPYLIGWRGYFGFCQTLRVLTNLEAWIRRRLRAYLWRQWQNGRNRFNELRQRGLSTFPAAVAAVRDRLPLKVGDGIGAAANERHDVIFDPAGAATAGVTGRGARVFPLEFARDRGRPMLSGSCVARHDAQDEPEKAGDHFRDFAGSG